MKPLVPLVAVTTLLTTGAHAAYTGLSVQEVDVLAEYTAAGYTPGPISIDLDTVNVYHVFAQFDNDTHGVVGVGGLIVNTDTAFVDYDGPGANEEGIPTEFGADIATNGDMIIDSFVTVNQLADPIGSTPAEGGFPFPDFVHGASSFVNGDPFTSEGASGYGVPIIEPVTDVIDAGGGVWQVLVAQIIVVDPDGSGPLVGHISGDMSLASESEFFVTEFTSIPAPGALALLGLCGVFTRRRPHQR